MASQDEKSACAAARARHRLPPGAGPGFLDTRFQAAGINPKIVSEMLGHSSVAITLDLYSHVLPDMQRDATEALEQVLTEPQDEPPNDDDDTGAAATRA